MLRRSAVMKSFLNTLLLASLLSACNETPAWQENCENVIEIDSGVHFTIAANAGNAKVGDSVELTIALINPTDEDVTYDIFDEGDTDGFRAYVIDAEGKRHQIGYMLNLNSGPRQHVVEVPAGARIEKKFDCLLGAHFGKGNLTELLPAGEYQLGVQLGDRFLNRHLAPEFDIGVLEHVALTIEDA